MILSSNKYLFFIIEIHNCRYVHHNTTCSDVWAVAGNVLLLEVAVKDHDYFVFLSSSVLGPFLPEYVKVSASFFKWGDYQKYRLLNRTYLAGFIYVAVKLDDEPEMRLGCFWGRGQGLAARTPTP